MSTKMPDVSEFQSGSGAPNWAGIKTQNGGAGIIRVGYGFGHLDNMFVSNYTAMKQLNYSFIGLYHYLRAGQDAHDQAVQFCKWVGPLSAVFPGTIFMLDLEEGSGDQSGRANAWLNYVDGFYGLDKLPLNQRSWLYSYTSFVNSTNLGSIFSSARHTWIAAYQNSEPTIPHSLWQCNDGQQGANITNWAGCGRVDTSITGYSIKDLASFAIQPVITPAPPVIPTQPEDPMLHISVTAPNNGPWTGTRTFLFTPGTPPTHIIDGSSESAIAKVLPVVPVTWQQYVAWGGK